MFFRFTLFVIVFGLSIFYSFTQTVSQKKLIRSIAGVPLYSGDGKLATKVFVLPFATAALSTGDVLIADNLNSVIRKVDSFGIISTVAGLPRSTGYEGDGGPALQAKFSQYLYCLTVNANDEIYICDSDNYAIRKIWTNGTITTIAGGNGVGFSGDGGLARNAKFAELRCAVETNKGELYICDSVNHVIRKVFQNGTIVTVAGTPQQYGYSGDGGLAVEAKLFYPISLHVTPQEELVIVDSYNHVIRKVDKNGVISTLFGRYYEPKILERSSCFYNSSTGLASDTHFCFPSHILVSSDTNEMIITDSRNCIIRKVFSNFTIATIAGKEGECGYNGETGDATQILLNMPLAVMHSPTNKNDLLISDTLNLSVRKLKTETNSMEPFAGINILRDDVRSLYLSSPAEILVTSKNELYIADSGANVIKKYDKNGKVTIVAGIEGKIDWEGDGIPAVNSTLKYPYSIQFDEKNQLLYIADCGHQRIRMVDRNGIISTVVGYGDNAPYENRYSNNATQVSLSYPSSIALNSKLNELYIADATSSVVRKVYLNNGTVEIVAGQIDVQGYSGDGEIGTNATLDYPYTLAFSEVTGELYIADSDSQAIRKLFANGTIVTLIANVSHAIIPFALQSLFEPHGLFIDPQTDDLYFTDNSAVYIAHQQNRTVELILGTPGQKSFVGENTDPSKALFYDPYGIFVTKNGSIYVADTGNSLVRKIAPICTDYSMSSQLQVNTDPESPHQIQILTQQSRQCITNEEYFEAEYLPFVKLKYNQTKSEFKKLILSDWNQLLPISVDMRGQQLDQIFMQIDACSDLHSVLTNCQFSIGEYAIVPQSTFLIVPKVTTAQFINYYSTSPLVKKFEMQVQFNHTHSPLQMDSNVFITTPGVDVTISHLNHSTSYIVTITTMVVYENGLSFVTVVTKQMETPIGEAPSVNVQQFKLEAQVGQFLLTWEPIPPIGRGNSPITRLELEQEIVSTSVFETKMIAIEYDPEDNLPLLKTIENVDPKSIYSFRIRSCNDVGCSGYSNTIIGDGKDTLDVSAISSLTLLLSIVIPVGTTLLILFVCILLIIALVFGTIIIVIVLQKKKKTKFIAMEMSDQILEELVSKEFRIEEDKIDTSNSVFLGSGASGSVVTAKYFNMDVAVKIISKTTAGMEADLSDFYNELKFLHSNAMHNNIIRFFGVYDSPSNNRIGLVMEFCSNGNVASYVMKHQLSLEDKLKLILGISQGMAYLHFHNIAHRDLKCENVLLDANLTPKIIDFGFSRVISEEANKSMNLTMNVGTAVYCAPEVIKSQVISFQPPASGQSNHSQEQYSTSMNSAHSNDSTSTTTQLAYDKKCDVYSFAIVMYVIYFQNKNPYGEVNDAQILLKVSSDPDFRPKISDSIPENERWLVQLIKQCWSTNPQIRPTFEQICYTIEENMQ